MLLFIDWTGLCLCNYCVTGAKVLFAGVQPRVLWISIGGFFFFGSYEKAKSLLYQSSSAPAGAQ